MDPRIYTFATPGTTRLRAEIQSGDLDISTHDAAETVVEVHPASDELARRGGRRPGLGRSPRVRRRQRGHDRLARRQVVRLRLRQVGARARPLPARDAPRPAARLGRRPRRRHLRLRARAQRLGRRRARRDHAASPSSRRAAATCAPRRCSGRPRPRPAPATCASAARAARCAPSSAPATSRSRDADGPVEAKTGSGDVRIDAVAEGSVQIKSGTGDVAIGVLPGALVRFDVTSATGDIISDLDVGDDVLPGDADGRQLESEVRTRDRRRAHPPRLATAAAARGGLAARGRRPGSSARSSSSRSPSTV